MNKFLFSMVLAPVAAMAFQVGAWVGGPGQYPQPTQQNVQAFQDLQGTHLDLISYFALFDINDWNATAQYANVAKNNGSTLVVTWMANGYNAQELVNGKADNYIRDYAKGVKGFGDERCKRRRSFPPHRENLQGRRRHERQVGMDHQRLESGQRYHAHGQLPRRRLRGLHLHRRLQLGHVPELVQLADVLAGFQEGVQRAREHRQAALYRRNLKLREARAGPAGRRSRRFSRRRTTRSRTSTSLSLSPKSRAPRGAATRPNGLPTCSSTSPRTSRAFSR